MNFLIQFQLVLIAKTVIAVIFKSNGITINYHINFTLKCQTVENRLSLLLSSTIHQCLRECGLRNHCAALNFWRLRGVCELFASAEENGTILSTSCIRIRKRDIDIIEIPCDDCSVGMTCDIESRTCVYKECSSIDSPEHGKVFGNVNKIGALRRQICTEGYHLDTGSDSLVCSPEGQWNVTQCIQDCIALANYMGNLTITSEGYNCQRWEMNFPHQHIYHSNEYFPDGSETKAENYCRAAGYDYLWCYTTDLLKRWDICDTPEDYC